MLVMNIWGGGGGGGGGILNCGCPYIISTTDGQVDSMYPPPPPQKAPILRRGKVHLEE